LLFILSLFIITLDSSNLLSIAQNERIEMTTTASLAALVTIVDAHFRAGYQEARSPQFADCRICIDHALVEELIRAMLTEVSEEGHLTSNA
jgi:hypothetical protein